MEVAKIPDLSLKLLTARSMGSHRRRIARANPRGRR
jgi:hypothetical protein